MEATLTGVYRRHLDMYTNAYLLKRRISIYLLLPDDFIDTGNSRAYSCSEEYVLSCYVGLGLDIIQDAKYIASDIENNVTSLESHLDLVTWYVYFPMLFIKLSAKGDILYVFVSSEVP